MTLRSLPRRLDPNDLEMARRVVSRAERRALERAEELRAEAERLLKWASERTVDTEAKVREQFAGEMRALHEELEAAARRATVAESELELLRAAQAELAARARAGGVESGGTGEAEAVAPLQVVSPEAGQAAGAAAARLYAQAELDLARAREEAVHTLTAAARQAEELITAAVAEVERDTAIAAAAREQAQRDGEAAAALRAAAEAERAEAHEDAPRIRDEGRREAARLEEQAREAAARILEEARDEADRIREEGRREAAAAMLTVRRQLVDEILGLREAMNRARDSFETFLESTGEAAGRDPAGGRA